MKVCHFEGITWCFHCGPGLRGLMDVTQAWHSDFFALRLGEERGLAIMAKGDYLYILCMCLVLRMYVCKYVCMYICVYVWRDTVPRICLLLASWVRMLILANVSTTWLLPFSWHPVVANRGLRYGESPSCQQSHHKGKKYFIFFLIWP